MYIHKVKIISRVFQALQLFLIAVLEELDTMDTCSL